MIDQPGGVKWRDQFGEREDKAINERRWGCETEEIGGRTVGSLLAYIQFLAPIHKRVRIKLFGQSRLGILVANTVPSASARSLQRS